MYKPIQSNKSELFTELSEKEQEVTAGGVVVTFLESREFIYSAVEGSFNYSEGGENISVDSSSEYIRLRESNAMIFDFGSYYYPGRKYSIPPMELISRIMRSFY